jgi:HPt (histidine-containing phosphotransfer) domain-containing protein
MSTSATEITGSAQNGTLLTNKTALRPTCDAVDLAVLASFELVETDGEVDLVIELIDLFLDDGPLRLAALEEALIGEDEQSLKRTAHCLRGSSGSMGAQQMSLICAQLERIESADVSLSPRTLLNCLVQEFERVRQVLLVERQKRTADALEPTPAAGGELLSVEIE